MICAKRSSQQFRVGFSPDGDGNDISEPDSGGEVVAVSSGLLELGDVSSDLLRVGVKSLFGVILEVLSWWELVNNKNTGDDGVDFLDVVDDLGGGVSASVGEGGEGISDSLDGGDNIVDSSFLEEVVGVLDGFLELGGVGDAVVHIGNLLHESVGQQDSEHEVLHVVVVEVGHSEVGALGEGDDQQESNSGFEHFTLFVLGFQSGRAIKSPNSLRHENQLIQMEQFTQSDIKLIKKQPWWNACTATPYLLKGLVHEDSYLLLATNLKQTWALKASKEVILREKELYNKSIQTSSFQGVLDLLEKCIASYDSNSLYQFSTHNNLLLFDYSSVLKIYPIKWSFKLLPIKDHHHFDLLCEDLINPLVRSIQSLEQRCFHYKQALLHAEKEMLKRMNEKEKLNFQSKVEDTEEDWKVFVQPRMDKTARISQFQFTPQTHFFMATYATQKFESLHEPKKRQVEEVKHTNKSKEEMIMQAYEQSLQELFSKNDQSELALQQQSEPQKKKKKNVKQFL